MSECARCGCAIPLLDIEWRDVDGASVLDVADICCVACVRALDAELATLDEHERGAK